MSQPPSAAYRKPQTQADLLSPGDLYEVKKKPRGGGGVLKHSNVTLFRQI